MRPGKGGTVSSRFTGNKRQEVLRGEEVGEGVVCAAPAQSLWASWMAQFWCPCLEI